VRANIKLTLGEPHLRALIRGGEVKIMEKGVVVRMILKDIGFGVIQGCLDDAKAGIDHYKPYEEVNDV
jgi:hypothetical protein